VALVTAIAYDADRNLGRAYNDILIRLLPGDWVCFLDHDAIWTTRDWYRQLCAAIDQQPNAGLITAVTNRIGRKEQIAKGAPAGHDMLDHFAFGAKQRDQYGATLEDITDGPVISGVVMCLSQTTWREIGGFASGFFGVDNQAHRDVRRIGKRVYLMRGLYVQHFYRADGVGHTNAPRAKRK
jgi:GT2 family glycosyltransferase